MKNPRIVLISGANRGLGFEVAKQLAKFGDTVIVSARNAAKAQDAAKVIADNGGKTDFVEMDVSSDVSVEKASRQILEKYGRVDVLINNAGIFVDRPEKNDEENDDERDEPFDSNMPEFFGVDIDSIKKSLDTNTYGAIRLIRAFCPSMVKNNYGRIVNLSSGLGQLSEMNGGFPAYRLSKVALNAVTKIVADELSNVPNCDDVLIHSVCPGWVRTDMGGANAERSVEKGAETIVWLANLPKGGPNGLFFRDKEVIDW